MHFGIDDFICLVVDGAAFGMPYQDVAAAELTQKVTGNIPRVCARVILREILGSVCELKLIGHDQRLDASQIGKGRKDRDRDVVEIVIMISQSPRKLDRKSTRL